MAWSKEAIDGWLLVQTLHGAIDANPGLSKNAASAVLARQTQLKSQSTEERQAMLRTVARALRPVVDPSRVETMPLRARAILAGEVPRKLGQAWLNAAPAPRRGFRPSAPLVHALRVLGTERT